MSETTEPDIEQILINVAQLLDGWHNDGTAWTEWDESVRRDVTRCREAWIQHLGALRDLAEAWEKLTLAPSLKLLAAEPAYVKARSVILGQNKEARASEKYAAVVALTGMSAQLTAALQEKSALVEKHARAVQDNLDLRPQLASGAEQMTNLSLLLEKAEGDRSRLSASLKSEKERGDRLFAVVSAVAECGSVGCERCATIARAALSEDTPTTQPPVLSEEG